MTIYEVLFGTPERAARTLEEGLIDPNEYCDMMDALGKSCNKCANCLYEYSAFTCVKYKTISEWLNSEVVDK